MSDPGSIQARMLMLLNQLDRLELQLRDEEKVTSVGLAFNTKRTWCTPCFTLGSLNNSTLWKVEIKLGRDGLAHMTITSYNDSLLLTSLIVNLIGETHEHEPVVFMGVGSTHTFTPTTNSIFKQATKNKLSVPLKMAVTFHVA